MSRAVVPAVAAAAALLAFAAPGRALETPCQSGAVQKGAIAAVAAPCNGPLTPCQPAERPRQD